MSGNIYQRNYFVVVLAHNHSKGIDVTAVLDSDFKPRSFYVHSEKDNSSARFDTQDEALAHFEELTK